MAASEKFFKVTDISYLTGLSLYAASEEMRGKTWGQTLRKLLGVWLRECIKRMPKGDKSKVDKNLLKTVRAVNASAAVAPVGKRGKVTKKASAAAQFQNEYRNKMVTLAVMAFNYYGARGAKTPGEVYRIVNRYYQAKVSSTRTHIAALVMPLRELRAGAAGSDAAGVRKLKNPAHELTVRETDSFASVAVEAWASAKKTKANPNPKGMEGQAGDVFAATMQAVEDTAMQWYQERLMKSARGAGFTVK